MGEARRCRYIKGGERKSGAKRGGDGEHGGRGASLAGCVGEMNV